MPWNTLCGRGEPWPASSRWARCPADVADLARATGTLSDRQLGEVVAAADGNPLIAVEWARALGRGEHEPPASLRGAVRSALAPITPQSLLLVQLIAVAGRDLDLKESRRFGSMPRLRLRRARWTAACSGRPVTGSATDTRCYVTPSTAEDGADDIEILELDGVGLP